MSSSRPDDAADVWIAADAVHIDVRGLAPPQPMIKILNLIDSKASGPIVIAHLDREPVFLYPELDDRGWSHEILPSTCGDADCMHDVQVRLVRMTR